MYSNKKHINSLLLRYLNQYLSKNNLHMKFVVKNIKKRIENNKPITIKQFKSIIKFIEREVEFVTYNRSQIFQIFEPIIEREVITYGNDLTEHFK